MKNYNKKTLKEVSYYLLIYLFFTQHCYGHTPKPIEEMVALEVLPLWVYTTIPFISFLLVTAWLKWGRSPWDNRPKK